MRARIVVAVVVVAVAVAAFGGTAQAKGPTGAEITGEGITTPIAVHPDFFHANLIEETGFYAAAFGQEPNSMLAVAPGGELGPRYTIAWSLPWSDGGLTAVDQDIYPYARGGPVVYTAPGQEFYGSERTRGGWFRAPTGLVARLQTLGIPKLETSKAVEAKETRAVAAPAASRKEVTNDADPSWLLLGASLPFVVAAAALVLIRRRRRNMVPTT